MTATNYKLRNSSNVRYDSAMAKHTSLYLEEELLRDAGEILGTSGPTGTVKAALEDVVRRARLKSLTSWEIGLTPADLEELRRPDLESRK
jgi:hypothetical protein